MAAYVIRFTQTVQIDVTVEAEDHSSARDAAWDALDTSEGVIEPNGWHIAEIERLDGDSE